MSEKGKGVCQCPTECPLTSEPVCGSDDVTYTNYCHLRQTSCQNKKNIRVRYQRACGKCPCNSLQCTSVRKIISLRRNDKTVNYRFHHHNSSSWKFSIKPMLNFAWILKDEFLNRKIDRKITYSSKFFKAKIWLTVLSIDLLKREILFLFLVLLLRSIFILCIIIRDFFYVRTL